ncbi:MAG: 5-formyltetrahydrofolate cyclo-ligase [Tannerella sp.]|jgi:5-formyltetrahydrofolate cyclo-ligase|nr:5-formyltetrahydrofolate cyclo-ligase [Tannerella sp.]
MYPESPAGMEPETHKQQWRRRMAALKKQYGNSTLQRRLSEQVWRHVEQLPQFREARRIACYHALPDEVQTTAFLEKWRRDRLILLPAVRGETMIFLPYRGEESLRRGAFHLMEPDGGDEKAFAEPELILVPGVAFDRRLNRLGRGKGYYDRFLSAHPVPAAGVCFQFQLFDRIPVDSHDRKMTWIVTEEETVEKITDTSQDMIL